MDILTLENKINVIESTNLINKHTVIELESLLGDNSITNKIPLNRISTEDSHLYVTEVVDIVRNAMVKAKEVKAIDLNTIRRQILMLNTTFEKIISKIDNIGNDNAAEFFSVEKTHIFDSGENLIRILDLDLIDAVTNYPIVKDILGLDLDPYLVDNNMYLSSRFLVFLKQLAYHQQDLACVNTREKILFNPEDTTFTVYDLYCLNIFKNDIVTGLQRILNWVNEDYNYISDRLLNKSILENDLKEYDLVRVLDNLTIILSDRTGIYLSGLDINAGVALTGIKLTDDGMESEAFYNSFLD